MGRFGKIASNIFFGGSFEWVVIVLKFEAFMFCGVVVVVVFLLLLLLL